MRALGYPVELAHQLSKRVHYSDPADGAAALRAGLAATRDRLRALTRRFESGLARVGIETGATFDRNSGLPMTIYAMPLTRR